MNKTWIAIALVALSFASPSRSYAGPPDTPIPLSEPIKFPWSSIEGIWSVRDSAARSEFSFQVQNDCEGRQILKVFQLDPATGMIVAEGTGYKTEPTLEVYAAMVSAGGTAGSYVLHIGAFRDAHAPQKRIVILTVMPFSGGPGETRFRLTKETGRLPVEVEGETPATCGP